MPLEKDIATGQGLEHLARSGPQRASFSGGSGTRASGASVGCGGGLLVDQYVPGRRLELQLKEEEGMHWRLKIRMAWRRLYW